MVEGEINDLRAILERLGALFGKDITTELVQTYWHALRDLHLSTIERVATAHTRFAKFFPKPVELRPRDDRAVPLSEDAGTDEFKSLETRRLEAMDWERVERPVAFAIGFNISHCGKKLVGLTDNSPGYVDALREYRYWLDMATQTFEVQCAALPTFAAEHNMSRAQRIERMNYIRGKRAAGIKANQLVFPQDIKPQALPVDTGARW